MAERITRVVLEAEIVQFEDAMRRAGDATKQVSVEGKKLAETHAAMTTLGTAGLVMGAALAAGIGVAVSKFAEFDQAMSNVEATGEDARRNQDALRQAALDAGAATVFSATESANAIEEMAKAGLSAKDILGGGLSGALDLAAAGGLDVADAAGIAATALKVFNLEGEDMSHVADLLAAGAGKAMGDVTDLSAALSQGGQVAAATGLSIEETTATLAAFASQGLLGSDAGTSFKTMLQRLTPQSDEAAAKMEELGISAYDAAGNFVGMEKFAGNLQSALADLTPEQRNAALSVMFGSDAVRAANVIYKEGEEGIRGWISAVDDQGYAAETAAQRLDNLIGDWEAFTGALDTAFITMGEGLDGPLRGMVQGLTGLVDQFNELPDGGKQAVLWIGLVTAGVGLLGGAALVAIPKLAALQIAWVTLTASGSVARAGLARFVTFLTGPWGIAMIAATTAVVALTYAQDKLRTSTEVFQNVLKNADSVDEIFTASDKSVPFFSRLEQATGNVQDFKTALDQLTNNSFLAGVGATAQLRSSLSDIGDELSKLSETDAPAAADAFKMITKEMDLSKSEQIDLLNAMEPYRDALVKQADAQDKDVTSKSGQIDMNALLAYAMSDTATATDDATTATSELEAATAEAVGELDEMIQALNDVAGGAMSMSESHDAALSSINALVEAAKAEGVSLEGVDAASINFRDSLRDVEQAHRDSATSILENNGTLEAAQAEWQAGRDKVIEMRVAMGESREEAVAWADQNLGSASQVVGAMSNVSGAINNVPKNPVINLTANTAQAYDAIMGVQAALRSVTGDHSIHVSTGQGGQGGLTFADGGLVSNGVKEFASGDFLPGIYPATPGGIHRFAEAGYDEMYGTADPKHRARTRGIWTTFGDRMGFTEPQQAPSLEGLSISGTLDLGNGLTGFVDGRIGSYDASANRASRGGIRS